MPLTDPSSQYCTLEDLPVLGLAYSAIKNMSDTDKLTAIKSSSSLIDTYLRGGSYTLPLEEWGRDLAEAAAAITVWRLIKARGEVPDAVRMDYEDKIRWLERVAAGTSIPDVVQPGGEPPPTVSGVLPAPQVFSSSQRGWYTETDDPNDGGPFSGGRR
jgi:phage gp36-like protein